MTCDDEIKTVLKLRVPFFIEFAADMYGSVTVNNMDLAATPAFNETSLHRGVLSFQLVETPPSPSPDIQYSSNTAREVGTYPLLHTDPFFEADVITGFVERKFDPLCWVLAELRWVPSVHNDLVVIAGPPWVY